MNQGISNLLPSPAAGAPDTGAAAVAPGSGDSSAGADIFRLTLAQKIAAAAPAPTGAPTASGSLTTQAALEAKITAMLKAGASESEIVTALSAQLAASVAQKLGLSTSDARAQLAAVFARALAPPGDGAAANEPLAERIRTLARRAMKLEDLATEIATSDPGQQNRFTGNLLDAVTAKEPPAHLPISTPAGVTSPAPPTAALPAAALPTGAAVAAPDPGTSPDTPAPAALLPAVAASTAAPVAAKGDGRSVTFDPSRAASSGGDTVLGRLLARAANVAQGRDGSPVDASVPPAPSAGPRGDVSGSASVRLEKFMRAFETALQSGSVQNAPLLKSAVTATLPNGMLPAADAPASNAAAFVPAVAPFSIDTAARVAAPSGPPLPPRDTVDHGAIVDQVVRGAFMRTNGESSEMRLSLVPETLGDVNVKLVVTNGNVTAHIIAQTPEVREALIGAQPQLSKSLADSGLKLQSFTVDLSGSGFTGFSGQQGQPHGDGRARRELPEAQIDGDDLRLEAVPSFGPPVPAQRQRGDYNYLA